MRPGAVIFDRISHLVSGSYKVTMGSDDGTDSELDKYAPKWVRERPAAPKRLRSVGTSTSTPRWSEEEHRDRRIRSLRPEPVPEPPARPKDRLVALMERFVRMAAFATVVALLANFGKSLLQNPGVLEPDSPPIQSLQTS
jgi:hypothetical protein